MAKNFSRTFQYQKDWEEHHKNDTVLEAKSYASTFIYSKKDSNGKSTEQTLIEFILKSSKDRTRINKNSTAFAPILNSIKERQKTAVLYRVLMNPDVVLAISPTGRELPSSFKVFYATDVASMNRRKKIFIDVTGLIKEESGYFTCKNIDILCAHLLAATVVGTYYTDTNKITNNATITRLSAECFVRMFTGVLDNLRVVNYNENREKIAYIVGVYYLFSLVEKDLKTAETISASINKLDQRTANAYRYYYEEEHLESIDTFVRHLTETFNMKGLTTDIFVNRWLTMYGNGSMYATELMPLFLITITNAFSGSYINRQNTIENMCGRSMVTLSETLIRVGAETYDKGFVYDKATSDDLYSESKRV